MGSGGLRSLPVPKKELLRLGDLADMLAYILQVFSLLVLKIIVNIAERFASFLQKKGLLVIFKTHKILLEHSGIRQAFTEGISPRMISKRTSLLSPEHTCAFPTPSVLRCVFLLSPKLQGFPRACNPLVAACRGSLSQANPLNLSPRALLLPL